MPGAFEPKIFFGLALGAKRRARRPPMFKIDDHAPEIGKIFFGLALGAARRARRPHSVVRETHAKPQSTAKSVERKSAERTKEHCFAAPSEAEVLGSSRVAGTFQDSAL